MDRTTIVAAVILLVVFGILPVLPVLVVVVVARRRRRLLHRHRNGPRDRGTMYRSSWREELMREEAHNRLGM